MTTLRESIEVNVPVDVVYREWADFERFPQFMDNIEDVRKTSDRMLHWKASIGGRQEEWDAEITENIPEERIAWRSITGNRNDGIVEFEPLTRDTTRINVQLNYEPQGVTEKIGSAVGMDERSVRKDLENFKRYVETGAHH